MRPAFRSVVLLLFTQIVAAGATDPTALLQELRQIRALSSGLYYFWPGNPAGRMVYVVEGRWTLGGSWWYTRGMRGADFSHIGDLVLKVPGASIVEAPVGDFKKPTEATDRRALELARNLVDALSGQGYAKEKHPVPFDVLARIPNGSSEAYYDQRDEEAARQGCAKNPSTLLALTYAELALVQRELRQFDDLINTLLEATEKLGLERVDFKGDVDIRKRLPGALNFGRPEICLLYLVAEEYRRRSRFAEAVKWYKVIIRNDPAGPYSWESVVRLRMVLGADHKEAAAAQKAVLETFPCVWGCVQEWLLRARITTKEQFAQLMPGLIEQVIDQVRKEDKARK
jgi:tetratricopeptide (TPR) repeat protein